MYRYYANNLNPCQGKWLELVLVFLLSLFLSSCYHESSTSISTTAENSPNIVSNTSTPVTPASVKTESLIAIATPALGNTKTFTKIPSLSATITPYPVETLTDEMLVQRMDVLKEQTGCLLPCWNNLIPGTSSSSEVQAFFARLGVDIYSISKEGSFNIDPVHDVFLTYINSSEVTVYWTDRTVTRIEIWRLKNEELFNVTRVASILGTPDLIKIGSYGKEIPYTIFLVYKSRNVYIELHGKGRYRQPTDNTFPFEACLSNRKGESINFVLFSETEENEIISKISDMNDWPSDLKISTSELFEQLKQEQCVPFK